MALGGTAVDVGTGAVVTFATSGFTAQLVNLTINGIARTSVPTSHMGTVAAPENTFGNMTFMPGDLSDPGELVMEVHFNPDTEPPIDQPAEVINIDFHIVGDDQENTAWDTNGFVTNYEVGTPLEDKMTATLTVKLTGNITIDPSVAAA